MRNRYVFIADILIVALAVWAAYGIRFGFLFIQFRTEFIYFLISALFIKLSAYYAFGLYRRYWRYAGYWDFVAVFLARKECRVPLSRLGSRVALTSALLLAFAYRSWQITSSDENRSRQAAVSVPSNPAAAACS